MMIWWPSWMKEIRRAQLLLQLWTRRAHSSPFFSSSEAQTLTSLKWFLSIRSSRSHAVFTLLLTMKRRDESTNLDTEKVSRIRWVALQFPAVPCKPIVRYPAFLAESVCVPFICDLVWSIWLVRNVLIQLELLGKGWRKVQTSISHWQHLAKLFLRLLWPVKPKAGRERKARPTSSSLIVTRSVILVLFKPLVPWRLNIYVYIGSHLAFKGQLGW